MEFAEGSKGGEEGDGSAKGGATKEWSEQSASVALTAARKADDDEESVVADAPAPAPSVPARMSDRGILRRGSAKLHPEAGGKRLAPACVSHSSASFAASHIASTSSRPQHLHSASSEEESEAEADDEDSHSRRSPSPPRSYKRFPPLSKKQRKPASIDRPLVNAKEMTKRKATMSIPSRPLSVSIETPASSNCGSAGGPSSLTVDKPPHKPLSSDCGPPSNTTQTTRTHRRRRRHRHFPRCLPTFGDPRASMWTSTHDANAPSEDRFSSLVNVMLRPPRSNERGTENISSSGSSVSGDESGDGTSQMDEATQVDPRPHPDEEDNTSLIRMSLWSVIDGHGGGCVATYASEVLLPHIAASVARALNCTIVDRGACTVNGQLRDANALDLDGLIRSSDRSKGNGNIDVVNPNSIHYRSPGEDSESEGEAGVDHTMSEEEEHDNSLPVEPEPPVSVASSLLPRNPPPESASSVKTSVKTAVSPVMRHAPIGTHSPSEVADITKAITDSFLSVDEGWINSIDPITTHQTACISNGRWNAGACALVVFTIQRLDWTRSSTADPETECGERGAAGGEDTSHNKDAARRRKLDYATKSKSVSSLSTLSSTSSLATVGPLTAVSVQESEITETEDDDDVSDIFGPRRRGRRLGTRDDPHHQDGVVISTPGGCKCHYYRPHDAMLYTAHVGDCRAVMLGSAPPRTIKVRPEGEAGDSHPDSSDDYSSCDSSSGESEGLSSSDRDSDSSDGDDEVEADLELKSSAAGSGEGGYMAYMRRPAKRQCRRGASNDAMSPHPPYVPLPPLSRSGSSSSEESEAESDDSTLTTALPPGPERKTRRSQQRTRRDLTDIAQKLTAPDAPPPSPALPHPLLPPPLPLSPLMRPIDLTTDHSAYNPAEVTAVLRRCNNAPRAISSASGGGIKRVAGSLAVTRALGDAYLKTPRLSFFPYKRHAPYITARPEVNCRLLSKGGDRVLILATDGVWERCTGDDVLRWVRNYYNERIAGVERHHFRHRRLRRTTRGGHRHHHHHRRHEERDNSSENRPLSVGPPASSDRSSENEASSGAPAVSDGVSDASLSGQVSDGNLSGHKRKRGSAASTTTHSSSGSSRGGWRSKHSSSHADQVYTVSTVSDVIVRRVLNKVRRARNMPNLRALMELPKGRSRRSKHDDITASVVDMSGFIS